MNYPEKVTIVTYHSRIEGINYRRDSWTSDIRNGSTFRVDSALVFIALSERAGIVKELPLDGAVDGLMLRSIVIPLPKLTPPPLST